MLCKKNLIIWTQWMQKVGLTTKLYALKKIINKLKPMKEIKTLVVKRFNFEVNDRVKVSKNAPMYGKNNFHPANMEGTLISIRQNGDSPSNACPLYIVWDNDQLSANALQDIELVNSEGLKNRFTYNLEELFFKDAVPETVDDVLPLLYSEKYETAVETYYKNDFGTRLHCKKGKLRSFDDIYYLFKAYFPEETHESVFKRMLLFKVTSKQLKTGELPLQLSECSTIKRIRYIPFGSSVTSKRLWKDAMESKQYESFMHWKDLFKLINVNSSEELESWYAKELLEPIVLPLTKKA